MGYLSLRVKDLKRYGLKPEFVSYSNVPAKAHLGSGVVIASVA